MNWLAPRNWLGPWNWLLPGRGVPDIHKQLTVARLLAAGLPLEKGNERLIPVGQRVQRLLHLRDGFERVHPLGPGTQLSQRLWSAQEQDRDQAHLLGGQRQ